MQKGLESSLATISKTTGGQLDWIEDNISSFTLVSERPEMLETRSHMASERHLSPE